MVDLVARRVLPLPEDGSPTVGGVTLPPGHRAFTLDDPQPVAWESDAALPEPALRQVWLRLVEAFGETGLWPVARGGDADLAELLGPPEDPRGFGPAVAVDLSRKAQVSDEWLVRESDVAWGIPGEITLPDRLQGSDGTPDRPLFCVPVERPADVPDRVGWTGPCNSWLDPDECSALLRTWEDRFGAYLIELGWDTLMLHVSRPPQTREQCEAVARESAAFSADLDGQALSPADIARDLPTMTTWSFWWD